MTDAFLDRWEEVRDGVATVARHGRWSRRLVVEGPDEVSSVGVVRVRDSRTGQSLDVMVTAGGVRVLLNRVDSSGVEWLEEVVDASRGRAMRLCREAVAVWRGGGVVSLELLPGSSPD